MLGFAGLGFSSYAEKYCLLGKCMVMRACSAYEEQACVIRNINALSVAYDQPN